MEAITRKPIIRLRYNLNLQIIAGNACLRTAYSALTQAVTATVVQIGSKVLPASASDEDIRNATSVAYTKMKPSAVIFGIVAGWHEAIPKVAEKS